jgi:hypothetical protein
VIKEIGRNGIAQRAWCIAGRLGLEVKKVKRKEGEKVGRLEVGSQINGPGAESMAHSMKR